MCNTPQDLQLLLSVHIDDMAAAVSNKAEMARLKEDLGKLFSLMTLEN